MYSLLAMDPATKGDVQKAAEFFSKGCRSTYAQQVLEKVHPDSVYDKDSLN